MKQLVSTISSKGQITIPAELRQHLGVREGDKRLFILEDNGEVRVQALQYATIDSLVGAAVSLSQPPNWDQIMDVLDQERAAKYKALRSSHVSADSDAGANE
jgi:antitoxin PrlF